MFTVIACLISAYLGAGIWTVVCGLLTKRVRKETGWETYTFGEKLGCILMTIFAYPIYMYYANKR